MPGVGGRFARGVAFRPPSLHVKVALGYHIASNTNPTNSLPIRSDTTPKA